MAAAALGVKFTRDGASVREVIALTAAFSLITPIGIAIGMAVEDSDEWVVFTLDALSAGTFLFVGASEATSDLFETDDKQCNDDHGHGHGKVEGGHNHSKVQHMEEGKVGVAVHTHLEHKVSSRKERMLRFAAMFMGVVVICLAQLSHPEHDHGDAHAGHSGH